MRGWNCAALLSLSRSGTSTRSLTAPAPPASGQPAFAAAAARQDRRPLGRPLAINDPNYRDVIVPEQTANMRETLQTLARILPLSNEEIDRLVRDRTQQRAFLPITVKANLAWDTVSRIEVNLPDLRGASI